MTEKAKKSDESSEKQSSFWAGGASKEAPSVQKDPGGFFGLRHKVMNRFKKTSPDKKVAKKAVKKPPTEMMEIVAAAVPVEKKLKRSFSDEKVSQFLQKQADAQKANADESEPGAFKKEMKRIKRLVLDMEAHNRDRLILYKSSEDGRFYKALNTSALYYAYRLADRMGRKCSVMVDSDRFSKAMYVASVSGIEKFILQFKELEGGEPEITLDGVYIFPLKNTISDEDLRMLRQTEKTRQEKMHNLLMPKKMAPAVYQQILMIIRQLAPKSEKLRNESVNYRVFGNEMLKNLRDILAIYSDWTNGIIEDEMAFDGIMAEIGKIKASLIILGETRKWGAVPLAAAGDNINILENMVIKEFNGEN